MDPSVGADAEPALQQVAAALLIIQFVLVIAVFFGALLSAYWLHRKHQSDIFHSERLGKWASGAIDFGVLLTWLIATVLPILFTRFFYQGWLAIGFTPPYIDVREATLIAFLVNVCACSWFIFRSGGWAASPFISVVGALPAFSILLGEPYGRTFLYISLILTLMGVGLARDVRVPQRVSDDYRDRLRQNLATWVLAGVMLLLTTAVGYVTSKPAHRGPEGLARLGATAQTR